MIAETIGRRFFGKGYFHGARANALKPLANCKGREGDLHYGEAWWFPPGASDHTWHHQQWAI